MDKYRLIRKRGEGTFAEVWEVEDERTGNRAALKVLKKPFKSFSEVSEDVEFRVLKLFSAKNNGDLRQRKSPRVTLEKASEVNGLPLEGPFSKSRSHKQSDKSVVCTELGSRSTRSSDKSTMASSYLMETSDTLLPPVTPRSQFSPHIAGLHDAFFAPEEGKVVFVLELLGQSLLEEIMERKKARLRLQQRLRAKGTSRKAAEELPLFHEGELRVLLFQILSGIHTMHTRGIFHRDIKPENILFQRPGSKDSITPRLFRPPANSLSIADFVGPSATDTLRLKLADFGSSQFISSDGSALRRQTSTPSSLSSTSTSISSTSISSNKNTHHVSLAKKETKDKSCYTEYIATRWYRSPECLLTSGRYGPAMDIWAVGCVAVELLTGHPFFPGDNETHQLQLIHDTFGPPLREDVERLIGPIGVHIATQAVFAAPRFECVSKSAGGVSLEESLSTAPATNSDDEDAVSYPRHPSLHRWKTRILPLILRGSLSDSLSDLLHRLLAYYPIERITATEALKHPFFSDVSPH